MRELTLKDAFKLSQIIDKMQIKTDINKLFDEAKKTPDAQAYIGGQMALILISRLHMAQKEVSQLLAELTGLSLDEIESKPLKEMGGLFSELLTKNDLKGFFNSAAVGNE